MRNRAPGVLIAALAALLVLPACGEDGGGGQSDSKADSKSESKSGGDTKAKTVTAKDIKVSGAVGKKPELTFDKPVKFAETDTKVVEPGDGPKVGKDQQVVVHYLGVNARTGKEFDSSWSRKHVASFSLQNMIAGFTEGLKGQKVGSRVLIGIPSEKGYPKGNPQAGIKKGDSLLFVVDIKRAYEPLTKVEGKQVDPPSSLPAVKLDGDAVKGIEKPKGDPPKELVVQPLIKGEGPKVEPTDYVNGHLLAANWRTGKTFDSTWQRGAPQPIPLPQVAKTVPGLAEGLAGQTVGSRVMVVIPPDQGFGKALPNTDVKKDDTTVLVVDILDAY